MSKSQYLSGVFTFIRLQKTDSLHHNIFRNGGDFFRRTGQSVLQPFSQQADTAGTGKGVKIFEWFIKGSVGAGDAFCAGTLYGIYNGWGDEEILKFASASAACNLFAENSIDGLREKAEIEKIAAKYGRKEMNLC